MAKETEIQMRKDKLLQVAVEVLEEDKVKGAGSTLSKDERVGLKLLQKRIKEG